MAQETNAKLKIGFLHPDLGIGGAERLVVDAAVGIQSKGHEVVVFTSHHDPKHCFEETKDGTLDIRVHGDFLPRDIMGRFYIVCAMLRQLVITLWILKNERDTFDVLFIDQLSACIPILKWFTSAKILFYCHHPDKVLTTRDSTLKKLYRMPIDKFEEVTTGMADVITVNSIYTGQVFKQSFKSLLKKPLVLYPPINFAGYDQNVDTSDPSVQILETNQKVLLSINRFERKKNVELALKAFVETKKRVSKDIFDTYRLVLAGGYDHRVIENVDYLKELDQLATLYGLETFTIRPGSLETPPATAKVVFLCSFNDRQRTYLLDTSQVMLYTPSFEHFGITPVEGMYACLPVIAANNGGPLETIKDKETGLLLDPTPEAWAAGLADMMLSKYDLNEMGKQGRDHVKAKFSLEAFAVELEGLLELTVSGGQPTHHRHDNVEYAMRVVVAVVAVVAWYKYLF